jgi:FdhD protein
MVHDLDKQSLTFRKTGGVHSAALGNQRELVVRYEDIGRHNAVDKVMGYAFLHQIPLQDKCLILSGRISTEIVLKVALNGIAVIVSRSAPTLQAVKMAERLGLTIIGFARGNRFNVYTHGERVQL